MEVVDWVCMIVFCCCVMDFIVLVLVFKILFVVKFEVWDIMILILVVNCICVEDERILGFFVINFVFCILIELKLKFDVLLDCVKNMVFEVYVY